MKMGFHDAGSPPLAIVGVRVLAYRGEIVFQAKPGETYTLYYGNPDAARPNYDLETLAGYVLCQDRVRMNFGVEFPNPH